MATQWMHTPIGPMPMRASAVTKHEVMSDREIADQALRNGTPHIDPEAYSELLHRGLSGPGWTEAATYQEIERRETGAPTESQSTAAWMLQEIRKARF